MSHDYDYIHVTLTDCVAKIGPEFTVLTFSFNEEAGLEPERRIVLKNCELTRILEILEENGWS